MREAGLKYDTYAILYISDFWVIGYIWICDNFLLPIMCALLYIQLLLD